MSANEWLMQSLQDAIEHEDWPCAESYAAQLREHLAEGRDAMSELLGQRRAREAFPGNHDADCGCRRCAARSWLAEAEAALKKARYPS